MVDNAEEPDSTTRNTDVIGYGLLVYDYGVTGSELSSRCPRMTLLRCAAGIPAVIRLADGERDEWWYC